MLRYYWKTNSNEAVISKKNIRRIEGGSWFSEEESNVRKVFYVSERIVLENGFLEVLKRLPEDFIQTPCWEEPVQEWSLHPSSPLYLHLSLGELQLLEIHPLQKEGLKELKELKERSRQVSCRDPFALA